jgi:hypothetical protein
MAIVNCPGSGQEPFEVDACTGRCPVCGRRFILREDGLVRPHGVRQLELTP